MDEAFAIRLAKCGDPEGHAYLYECNKRRIYCLCMRMVHNEQRAEELTHDVFLRLLKAIKSFRGDSKFSTWLHRLAVNIVLMSLRNLKSRNETNILSMDCLMEDGQWDVSERRHIDPADQIDLERAVAKLSPGYARQFDLYLVRGYEHHEIAQMSGRTIGLSKSQLHKCRKKLQRALRPTK